MACSPELASLSCASSCRRRSSRPAASSHESAASRCCLRKSHSSCRQGAAGRCQCTAGMPSNGALQRRPKPDGALRAQHAGRGTGSAAAPTCSTSRRSAFSLRSPSSTACSTEGAQQRGAGWRACATPLAHDAPAQQRLQAEPPSHCSGAAPWPRCRPVPCPTHRSGLQQLSATTFQLSLQAPSLLLRCLLPGSRRCTALHGHRPSGRRGGPAAQLGGSPVGNTDAADQAAGTEMVQPVMAWPARRRFRPPLWLPPRPAATAAWTARCAPDSRSAAPPVWQGELPAGSCRQVGTGLAQAPPSRPMHPQFVLSLNPGCTQPPTRSASAALWSISCSLSFCSSWHVALVSSTSCSRSTKHDSMQVDKPAGACPPVSPCTAAHGASQLGCPACWRPRR